MVVKLNDEPVYQSPITEVIADDLEVMLSCLPREILQHLTQQGDVGDLIEVVLDLGRFPQARFPVREIYLGETPVTGKDIESVTSKIGRFGDDNRAGIDPNLTPPQSDHQHHPAVSNVEVFLAVNNSALLLNHPQSLLL
jgi:hypothetical protein